MFTATISWSAHVHRSISENSDDGPDTPIKQVSDGKMKLNKIDIPLRKQGY